MNRGFLLQPTYQIERGRPVVCLWGKLEAGGTFLVRDDRQRPRFWIRRDDVERVRQLAVEPARDSRDRQDLAGLPVVPIETVKPGDVPPVRDRLRAAGIATYEADVRFAYRYLIDRGIRAAVQIEGTAREAAGVQVFENPDVKPGNWRPELSVLSIDIETDPTASRLLSVALVGCGASEVLLLTEEGQSCPEDAIPFPSETDLLRGLVRRVRELDPDVLTGWNLVDFDLFTLARMGATKRIELPLGRTSDPLRLRPAATPGSQHEATIPGRVVLDGIQLVRGAFMRFDSYSLDHVSREVLGEGKTIRGRGRASEILAAFRHDRPALVEYNRKDAQLVLDILEELRLVDLAVERSLLTGMPPNRVAASIASFDFLYLSELGSRGIVAPSVEDASRPMPQGGGTVLPPQTGLHRQVLVLDFKSLYPSVIRTFNIDPLGRFVAARAGPEDGAGGENRGAGGAGAGGGHRADEGGGGGDLIVAPNGTRFPREPGILPALVERLFERRENAKRVGDSVASQAIKIHMNSFYGVLGTPACRFSSPDLVNAITGWGSEILLWTRDRLRDKGYEVLYGDTDSLFVASGATGPEDALRIGAQLVEDLNRELAEHVQAEWRVESRLELELEKLYLELFLPTMRHGTAGAAKRYVGLEHAEPEPRVVFTGMEVVRRDWTELAKQVQRGLYERLFAHEPVEEYLRDVVERLRSGEMDELLVYRKGLRKKLESYTASTPPHVAAARKMKGRLPSVIEYVVTENGPEPAEERESSIDREHYVQKQVRPVAEPVLAELGLEFDVVVGDDRQLELF